MPKVSDEHRAAQRQRIQDAAIAVVQRRGIASTTMGDIIKESGLSAGAIYGYYAGKNELLRDIATTVVATKGEALAAMATTEPLPEPARALRHMLRSLPQEWIASGLLMQFWGTLGSEDEMALDLHEHARTLAGHATTYLRAWCRSKGLAEADAESLSRPFIALVQGYVLQASFGIATDLDAYAEAAQRLLDGALATR